MNGLQTRAPRGAKDRKSGPACPGVEESPRKVTVLRDFFGETEEGPVAALVDYVGEVETNSLGYRIGNRLVRANNDFISSITGIPGQLRDNWRLLSNPVQRRALARGLIDETSLTTRHRKALLSILLWSTILVYLVAAVVLGFVNREALSTYQSVWSLFFYSLATSMFLPTPFEILLDNAVKNLGVTWTVLIASFAKTVGTWLVLIAGDKASAGLDTLLARKPFLRASFNGFKALAQKFGLYLVFILFAIPFMLDTGPLFLAALLGFKKIPFLAVTFVAICTRSLLFIYAGDLFAAVF